MNAKQQAITNRQIIEADAMNAQPIKPVDTFQDVANFRRALVDWSHAEPILNHLAIVDKFNQDLAKSATPAQLLHTWREWAWEVIEEIGKRDKAQRALDAYDDDASGTVGWWTGPLYFQPIRDTAVAQLAKLANGPT